MLNSKHLIFVVEFLLMVGLIYSTSASLLVYALPQPSPGIDNICEPRPEEKTETCCKWEVGDPLDPDLTVTGDNAENKSWVCTKCNVDPETGEKSGCFEINEARENPERGSTLPPLTDAGVLDLSDFSPQGDQSITPDEGIVAPDDTGTETPSSKGTRNPFDTILGFNDPSPSPPVVATGDGDDEPANETSERRLGPPLSEQNMADEVAAPLQANEEEPSDEGCLDVSPPPTVCIPCDPKPTTPLCKPKSDLPIVTSKGTESGIPPVALPPLDQNGANEIAAPTMEEVQPLAAEQQQEQETIDQSSAARPTSDEDCDYGMKFDPIINECVVEKPFVLCPDGTRPQSTIQGGLKPECVPFETEQSTIEQTEGTPANTGQSPEEPEQPQPQQIQAEDSDQASDGDNIDNSDNENSEDNTGE